jgi:tRNA(Glu) U13 pseudouridine synthase TruD
MFVIRQGLEEINRAENLDISAVIPMHGKNVKISEGRAGEIETEIFNDLGFREDVFSKVSGSRRISRIRLGEVSIIPKPDGYVASFFLPKGGFGTCLIRELTKRNDVF